MELDIIYSHLYQLPGFIFILIENLPPCTFTNLFKLIEIYVIKMSERWWMIHNLYSIWKYLIVCAQYKFHIYYYYLLLLLLLLWALEERFSKSRTKLPPQVSYCIPQTERNESAMANCFESQSMCTISSWKRLGTDNNLPFRWKTCHWCHWNTKCEKIGNAKFSSSKQHNFFAFKSYDLYLHCSGKPFIKERKMVCKNSYKGGGSSTGYKEDNNPLIN